MLDSFSEIDVSHVSVSVVSAFMVFRFLMQMLTITCGASLEIEKKAKILWTSMTKAQLWGISDERNRMFEDMFYGLVEFCWI